MYKIIKKIVKKERKFIFFSAVRVHQALPRQLLVKLMKREMAKKLPLPMERTWKMRPQLFESCREYFMPKFDISLGNTGCRRREMDLWMWLKSGIRWLLLPYLSQLLSFTCNACWCWGRRWNMYETETNQVLYHIGFLCNFKNLIFSIPHMLFSCSLNLIHLRLSTSLLYA